MALIKNLVREQFGNVPIQSVLLLNKTGGVDRADLVIAHGHRFGWLTFDPVTRKFSLDIAPEALLYILKHVTKGIVDLETGIDTPGGAGRMGGKKFRLKEARPDGTAIVKFKNRYGTGVVKDGQVRVKELMPVDFRTGKNPDWEQVVEQNRYHLKNLERTFRMIKQHIHDRPKCNVSFSGGKDSTAVLTLARKGRGNRGVLPRYRYRVSRNHCVCKITGRSRHRERPGISGRQSRRPGPGEGQPVVLQAPEVAPARAPPRRDRGLRHGAGQPVV